MHKKYTKYTVKSTKIKMLLLKILTIVLLEDMIKNIENKILIFRNVFFDFVEKRFSEGGWKWRKKTLQKKLCKKEQGF